MQCGTYLTPPRPFCKFQVTKNLRAVLYTQTPTLLALIPDPCRVPNHPSCLALHTPCQNFRRGGGNRVKVKKNDRNKIFFQLYCGETSAEASRSSSEVIRASKNGPISLGRFRSES